MARELDLSVYEIEVRLAKDDGVFDAVEDLPGCFAVGVDVAAFHAAVEQATNLQLETHLEAAARYR